MNVPKTLVKTEVIIKFDDRKQYLCYYDPELEKTYYKVLDEFIFVSDVQKANEVRQWIENQKHQKTRNIVINVVMFSTAAVLGFLVLLARKKVNRF